MINLVIVKNPFKTDKEIKRVNYIPEQSVYSYVQSEFMGLDVVISYNGRIISEEEHKTLIPTAGDYIAVCPVIEGGGDGKDLGRTLAVIGLSIITMGVGSMAAGGAFMGLEAVGAASWGFWSWVAAAGVQIAGGYLINQAFSPGQMQQNEERKQVYGWSQLPPVSQEGDTIPVTFGTVRMGSMAPIQILTQRVTTDGEKQYLNLLLSGGEGPIDSISNLRINDNPYTNYGGVDYEIRSGTNDQPIISNFNDTYFPQSISYELKEGSTPSIHQLNGEYQGIEVNLDFPAGLYKVNDEGEFKSTSVRIQLKYRRVGSSSWRNWVTKTISGKYIHAIRRVYFKHGLSLGRYEVSVQCTYKEGSGEKYSNKIHWTSVSGIVYDDFAYPNKALVGLRALATDQLSGGMPRISWTQTRSNIWIWNPVNGKYEQKPATNPAWACYDIIHRCRYMKNVNNGSFKYVVQGVPAAKIDYQAFADWAAFCKDRKITYNGVIYQTRNLWDSLKGPEQAGRGRVLMRGTRFSCVSDAPGEAVQLFNVSNTEIDSFKEEFLGTQDRANALELSFYNINNNYEKSTIPIYGLDYDKATEIPNPTQIDLKYAMTLEQAYRYGAYQLRVNHYINRTVSWSADIDAIACRVGDVVLLQHDVPRWGTGGRIELATPNTVTLDQEVNLFPGINYGIMIRFADDTLVEKRVQGVAEETTTDTIIIIEPFDNIPEEYDLFSFGEVKKIAKPFRLLSVSREGDFRCKLQAMEYIEEVYSEAENIPVIDYTQSTLFFEIEKLYVEEQTFTQPDGTITSQLWCSWSTPRGKKADECYIYYSTDKENWNYVGSTIDTKFRIDGMEIGETYAVRVSARVGVYISSGVISRYVYISGKDNLPTAPSSLTVAQQGAQVIFRWPEVKEPDIIGYEIRRGIDWKSGEVIISEATGDRTTSNNEIDGTHRYMIKSIDRRRQRSINYTSAIFEVSDTGKELNVIQERDELANIDNATLNNIDEINGKISFHHMFTLDDLKGYSLDDWPNIDALADGLPDFDGYAEYISEFIDTGHIGKTGIRLDKNWYFEDLGLSLLSYPDRSLGDFPNNTLDNPPAEYEKEIYIRFSNDNVEWTEWQSYLTGEYKFRYIQIKLIFRVETQTADFSFNNFVEIFDVPDIELEIDDLSVPTGGVTLNYIDYGNYFYRAPLRFEGYLTQDSSRMKYAKFANRTADGVDIQVLDIDNNDVGGTIEKLLIEGY